MWIKTKLALLEFQKSQRLIPNGIAGRAVLDRAEELAELALRKNHRFENWEQFNDEFNVTPRVGFNYLTAQRLLILADLYASAQTDQQADSETRTLHDPYEETFLRSPNQGSGKIKPKFIVLHHSDGSYAGGVSWIRQVVSRVSYHYLIDTDGRRTQFVWDTRRAWHAGESFWKGFDELNGHSIGVSLSGNTNKRRATDAEINSMAYKCIYLMRKFDLGEEAIVTHAMIAPDRKTDTDEVTHNRVVARVRSLLRDQ